MKDRLHNPKNVIIGVGNTNDVKGFDIFVKMACRFGDDVKFVWAGRCQKPFFNKVIKTAPSNFVYYGQIESDKEMGALYSVADILFLSSRLDSFPSAMIEAAGYGTPTIGFRCSGGASEFVRDGENGYLVKNKYSLKECEKLIRDAISPNTLQKWNEKTKQSAKKYGFYDYIHFLEEI